MRFRSAQPVARLPLWLPLLAATSAVLVLSAPARAGLVVTVESVPASAGAFDVIVTNTGSSAVTINSFSFEVNSTSSQVNFSDATTGTAATYIFDGNSAFGPTINTTSGQSLQASDFTTDIAGTSLGGGASLGLGHVDFTVTGVLSSAVTVTLSAFPITSLGGPPPDNANIPITTLQSGRISPGSTTVPEPSSLMCAALAIPIGAWLVRRTRRRLGPAAA